MTIQVEHRPDGLISITCGGEQILIDPFSMSPQSPGPIIASPPKKTGGGYGSPPPPPTVTFCIADPFRLRDSSDLFVLSPNAYPSLPAIIAARVAKGSMKKTFDFRLEPGTKIPLTSLTKMAEGSNLNIRLWVPRGEGKE